MLVLGVASMHVDPNSREGKLIQSAIDSMILEGGTGPPLYEILIDILILLGQNRVIDPACNAALDCMMNRLFSS